MPIPSVGYAQIATTIAQLKAITASDRTANYCLFVGAIGAWVYYSPTSTAIANDTTIIQPTDGIGRWIVTNQTAAPSGGSSGITKQPGIIPSVATLTDLQRALNQVLSALTAAGVTVPIIYTRSYDPANPTNDLINVLGTAGGTVTFANPHPSRITNTASSTGGGTVAEITNRINGTYYSANTSNSWVQIDMGATWNIKLTGIGIRSDSTSTSNQPANLTIEGGQNGAAFSPIFQWNNIGFTGTNQDRFTTFTESPAYRYIRIRQPGLDSSGGNYLSLGELYFYGTLSAL